MTSLVHSMLESRMSRLTHISSSSLGHLQGSASKGAISIPTRRSTLLRCYRPAPKMDRRRHEISYLH
jgi:hypothetical protein